MFKLIVCMLFFAAGLAVGIWWSAGHPQQAQIEAAMLQSKIDTIQQIIARHTNTAVEPTGSTPASDADLQQMLEQAKKDKAVAERKAEQH